MIKKQDIQNKDDIDKLVNHFYSKVMIDPIIGFFFTQVSPINLESHTPKITEFWNAILFGYNPLDNSSDSGGAQAIKKMLQTHQEVDAKARMQTGHFTRWLYLFGASVDELYEGENADKIKFRAKKMASSMSDALRLKRGEDKAKMDSFI